MTLPLWSEVSATLPADINDLVLTGTNNINGFGNELDNSLTGNDANNWLFGKAGDDIILGEMGSDRLIGGMGADTLTGGEGADFFIRKYKGGGIDTITDFNVAEDTFMISASGFGAGLVDGAAITSGQFTIGAVAVDERDRLIYNSTTGALLFDADGTGSSQQVQIAQLATGLAMTADNIFVFA